jgi:hypothetical protein
MVFLCMYSAFQIEPDLVLTNCTLKVSQTDITGNLTTSWQTLFRAVPTASTSPATFSLHPNPPHPPTLLFSSRCIHDLTNMRYTRQARIITMLSLLSCVFIAVGRLLFGVSGIPSYLSTMFFCRKSSWAPPCSHWSFLPTRFIFSGKSMTARALPRNVHR